MYSVSGHEVAEEVLWRSRKGGASAPPLRALPQLPLNKWQCLGRASKESTVRLSEAGPRRPSGGGKCGRGEDGKMFGPGAVGADVQPAPAQPVTGALQMAPIAPKGASAVHPQGIQYVPRGFRLSPSLRASTCQFHRLRAREVTVCNRNRAGSGSLYRGREGDPDGTVGARC